MNKFSIITPCFNSEKYIGETIKSVINQRAILSGRAELEYIICDGKSTDRTVEIIESFDCPDIKLISEKDSGMYDALSKGLQLTSGNIIAYINAGDYYHHCAFDIVLDIFAAKKANWLTGYEFFYNEKSYVINVALPPRYYRSLIRNGLYDGKVLPCIQQESTFWLAELNKLLDYNCLSNFKYAGDYYIWSQFAKEHDLIVVKAYIAGFKIQRNQLSENSQAYHQEMKQTSCKANIIDYTLAYFERFIMWQIPSRLKVMLAKNKLLTFDLKKQEWM